MTEAATFKGKVNIYTCKSCRGHIVTRDVDDGVTPASIRCKARPAMLCDGLMWSSMYRVFDQDMRESHQWYRPSAVEIVPPEAQEHVAQGGLLLREYRAP